MIVNKTTRFVHPRPSEHIRNAPSDTPASGGHFKTHRLYRRIKVFHKTKIDSFLSCKYHQSDSFWADLDIYQKPNIHFGRLS